MLVEFIVVHLGNLFCMCFGYVPRSSNFGVSCYYCWESIIIVQFSLWVQIMGCPSWRCYEVWKYAYFWILYFSYGHLSLTSFPSSIRQFRIKNLVIWHTITLLALWIIWKARCDSILTMVAYTSALCLMNSGCYLSTLRGQYDDL